MCPTAVAPGAPATPTTTSPTGWSREIAGAWKPDQYSNPNNPLSHYETTGPEIWAQTDGRVTHFVAGVGTGGTITGTGRYLKEVSDGRVRVIGADPEGSVYSGGTGRPYLVEGVGEDFWPTTYDPRSATRSSRSPTPTRSQMTRRLAREEGLLVGGSCGMAVVAALGWPRAARPDDVVVVLLPDGGRGYLSKIFNDEWMADYGFLRDRPGERPSATCCAARTRRMPALVHVHPNETVRRGHRHPARVRRVADAGGQSRAAGDGRRGRRLGRGARPARRAVHRARRAGRPAGAAHVAAAAHGRRRRAGRAAVAALEKADAALVLDDGKPVGVLTRQDLLGHLSR